MLIDHLRGVNISLGNESAWLIDGGELARDGALSCGLYDGFSLILCSTMERFAKASRTLKKMCQKILSIHVLNDFYRF